MFSSQFISALLLCIQLSLVLSQQTPNDTGRICEPGFFDNGNLCERCPLGTSSSRGSFECTACPSGSNVASTLDGCVSCFPGEFVDSNLVCTDCPRGEYSEVMNEPSCTKCPGNTTTDFEGAFDASICEGCRPGEGVGGFGSNSDVLCGTCSPGQYQDQDPGLDCIPCPPGTGSTDADEDFFFGGGGYTSVEECLKCPPGTYSRLRFGIRDCLTCPDGLIAPNEGTEECIECPPGFIAADGAIRCVKIDDGSSDITCPAGTEKNGTECIPCPTGTVNTNNSETECTLCRNGLIPSAKKDSCECPAAQILNFDGGCTECPERSVKLNETTCGCEAPFISLSDNFLECVCPYHFRRRGSNCLACNERQLAQSVKLRPWDCTLCREDTIFNPKSEKCDKCPRGTESPFGTIADKCQPCKNTYMKNGKLNCGCGPGTRLRGDVCEKCPPGTASNHPYGCDDCYAPLFSDVAGLKFCKKCPKGQRYDPTGRVQTKCPPQCPANSKPDYSECQCNSRYVEKRVKGKLIACTRCPGKQQADIFRRKCVCKKGFAVKGKRCKKCPAGTFSNEGLKCKQCDEKSFSRGTGNKRCKKCRPGSFSLFTGGKKCIFCKKGSFIRKKGDCGRCKPGFRVRNGSCVKCVDGVSLGGDTALCARCEDGKVPNKDLSQCVMLK